MNTRWVLILNGNREIENPDWDQISEALSHLNGESQSIVQLRLVTKGTLIAVGGDNKCYSVTYFPDDVAENIKSKSITLADMSLGSSGTISLTVEGVLTEFPSKFCIKESLLFKVFIYFFMHYKLPSDMYWEIENTGIQANVDDYF